ncbi:MAG: hypothetical protein J6X02_04285 [Bacilli bacterium]|nr:hypothetical protein [Bacilli bacterium]
MTYNVMDPVLIEIYGIKDINSISFYDLTLTESNQQIIVPSLLISYGRRTYFNLSVKDKYFDIYVKKVIEVYNEEKDSRYISIDSRSKKILENGQLTNEKEVTAFYDNKDSYDNSLIFQSDEIKSIMDIIRYEIKSFGEFANLNMSLSDNFRGYRTNYVMEATINGLFTYLLVQYDKISDDHYHISIGNLGGVNNNFIIDIIFTDDSLDISCVYKDILFNDYFNIDNKKATYIRRIIRDNKPIKFETGNLEKVIPQEGNIINIDYDCKDFSWYQLPWSGYFGHKETRDLVSGETVISSKHTIYLDINDDNFYKRDFYTKNVYSDSKASKIGITVILDDLRKRTYGFKNNKYYIVETGFKKGSFDANGEYQEKYSGKYYYHIIDAKQISDIQKDKLISVKKSVVNENADLLSDTKLKILRGNL